MFIFELLCENRFSLLLKNIERMETNEFQKAEEKRLEDFFSWNARIEFDFVRMRPNAWNQARF